MVRYFRMERCDACRLPLEDCFCASLQPLATRTAIVMFLHRSEANRPSNTGQLAASMLESCQIVLHGAAEQTQVPHIESSALVLHPEGRAIEPTDAGRTLLIADGTWSQVRHMMQRIPALRDAESVSVPTPDEPRELLRKARCAGQLSTCEALARALGIVEAPEIERALLEKLDVMLDRGFTRRGLHHMVRGQP